MYMERTDNMKGFFPEPPVLSGAELCLRPLALSDADSLRRLTRPKSSGACMTKDWMIP